MEKCPCKSKCKRLVAPLKAVAPLKPAATSDGDDGSKELEEADKMIGMIRFIRHMCVADGIGHNGSTSTGRAGGRRRNRKLGGRTRLHRNVAEAKAVRAYWSPRRVAGELIVAAGAM